MIISRPIAFLLLVFCFSTVVAAQDQAPASVSVDIVFASKMPQMEPQNKEVGGLSRLATYIYRKREAGGNFLFLHGGDSLAPSAMSSFDYGTHMIDLMNMIEPDVYSINERELAYKEDQLSNRISEASFPFVSSNIRDPFTGGNLEGAEDHLCFDIEGFDVCVMAILDPIAKESYPPDRLLVDDSIDHISDKANDLRTQGADLVILVISHAEEEVRQLIEAGVVDLALYTTSREEAVELVGSGAIVKQGTDKGQVAEVTLQLSKVDGALSVSYVGEIIALIDYERSPAIDRKIEYYASRLEEFMGVYLGKTATVLDTRKTIVRTEETAFGNMVTDALRDHYGADLALVNSGGIRGNTVYQPGAIFTRKTLQQEFPYRNRSIFITITGADLLAALENSVSIYEEVKGRFPQISGFEMRFCPTRPAGQRVISATTNAGPIDPNKTYTMATVDYLYKGGDGYSSLSKGEAIQGTQVDNLLNEIMSVYIENNDPVSTQVEGRMVNACP